MIRAYNPMVIDSTGNNVTYLPPNANCDVFKTYIEFLNGTMTVMTKLFEFIRFLEM